MGNLTFNFNDWEFDCKDGTKVPEKYEGNRNELAANLQVLRNELGKAIKLTNAYRTVEHNKKVGGSVHSQHLYCKAGDIQVDGVSPDIVASTIHALIREGRMKEGGLGRYNTFTHYDIRGTMARWDYRK